MNSNALKKAEETQLINIDSRSGIQPDKWTRIMSSRGCSKNSLRHGNANTLVLHFNKTHIGFRNKGEQVAQQYQGKEEWKKIYDRSIQPNKSLGDNLEILPKKANIGLRPKKQLATLKTSSKTSFGIGLNIKDFLPAGAFKIAGSWNTICIKRIKNEKHGEYNNVTH
jgi:hypothetical protein